jgi:hypothetical protein
MALQFEGEEIYFADQNQANNIGNSFAFGNELTRQQVGAKFKKFLSEYMTQKNVFKYK